MVSVRCGSRRGESVIAADEDGFATILGTFVIAAIVAVVAGVCYLGAATVARHRAQSAADLSALAAAAEQVAGGDGCAAATALAARQHPPAIVSACRIVDGRVGDGRGSGGPGCYRAAAGERDGACRTGVRWVSVQNMHFIRMGPPCSALITADCTDGVWVMVVWKTGSTGHCF